MQMMGGVQDKGKQDWTKDAANTEEAGHTAIENCVNVRPDNNLVGEEQIRSADQNGEYNFADENEHYEEWHFLFFVGTAYSPPQMNNWFHFLDSKNS